MTKLILHSYVPFFFFPLLNLDIYLHIICLYILFHNYWMKRINFTTFETLILNIATINLLKKRERKRFIYHSKYILQYLLI